MSVGATDVRRLGCCRECIFYRRQSDPRARLCSHWATALDWLERPSWYTDKATPCCLGASLCSAHRALNLTRPAHRDGSSALSTVAYCVQTRICWLAMLVQSTTHTLTSVLSAQTAPGGGVGSAATMATVCLARRGARDWLSAPGPIMQGAAVRAVGSQQPIRLLQQQLVLLSTRFE